jgi:hypothetical protein
VKYVSNGMLDLMVHLRGTLEYETAFSRISLADKFLMTKTVVFKFARRPAHKREKSEYSSSAEFFLGSLQRHKPALVRDLGVVVGLRCGFCMQSPQYLPGATNFVALCESRAPNNLKSALDGRRKHAHSCPWASNSIKECLAHSRTETEENNLEIFLSMWHNSVVPKLFQPTTRSNPNFSSNHAVPVRPEYQQFISRAIPERLVWDEREGLADLDYSFSTARKSHFTEANILIKDLTLLPSPTNVMETPFVECLVQSLEIAYRKNCSSVDRKGDRAPQPHDEDACADRSNNRKWEIFIQCRHCHGGKKEVFSTRSGKWNERYNANRGVLDASAFLGDEKESGVESITSQVLEFGAIHCRSCQSMPDSMRCLLASCRTPKQVRLDHDTLKCLLKEWKTYLQRCYLPQCLQNMIPLPDADLWGPVFDAQLLNEWSSLASGTTAEDSDGDERQGAPLLNVSVFQRNDVVVDDEFLRDLEGNRRFRQLISEHRTLYFGVDSPEQERVIAETLVEVIHRRGGLFYSVLPIVFETEQPFVPTKLSPEKCLAHVTRSLIHGFPELLRPPRAPPTNEIGSKCSYVEHAPLVGRLHRGIRWNLKHTKGRVEETGTAKQDSCPRTHLERNALHAAKSKAGGRFTTPKRNEDKRNPTERPLSTKRGDGDGSAKSPPSASSNGCLVEHSVENEYHEEMDDATTKEVAKPFGQLSVIDQTLIKDWNTVAESLGNRSASNISVATSPSTSRTDIPNTWATTAGTILPETEPDGAGISDFIPKVGPASKPPESLFLVVKDDAALDDINHSVDEVKYTETPGEPCRKLSSSSWYRSTGSSSDKENTLEPLAKKKRTALLSLHGILDSGLGSVSGVEEVAFDVCNADGTLGAYGASAVVDAVSVSGTGLAFYQEGSGTDKYTNGSSMHVFQQTKERADDLIVVDVDGSLDDNGGLHSSPL